MTSKAVQSINVKIGHSDIVCYGIRRKTEKKLRTLKRHCKRLFKQNVLFLSIYSAVSQAPGSLAKKNRRGLFTCADLAEGPLTRGHSCLPARPSCLEHR